MYFLGKMADMANRIKDHYSDQYIKHIEAQLREQKKGYSIKKTVKIDKEKIVEFTRNARRVKDVQLTKETYAVINIQDQYYPYKSLILSFDEDPLMSKESTNSIMKKEFNRLGFDYDDYKECHKILFNYNAYRLPYVFGGKIFAPLTGPSRNDATWCALHLANNYLIDEQFNEVILSFKNHVHLPIFMTEESFQTQLKQAAQMYQVYKEGVETILSNLFGDWVEFPLELQRIIANNIVVDYYHRNEGKFPISDRDCLRYAYAFNELATIKKCLPKDFKWSTIIRSLTELTDIEQIKKSQL